MAGPVAVGLHPSLAPSVPEVKYALRTLLRIAGVPHVFVWAGADGVAGDVDLYYGPRESACAARVRIDAAPIAFGSALALEPRRTLVCEGVPLLGFDGTRAELRRRPDGTMCIQNDIIFTSFWLLSGAREPSYAVNRWGDISLEGTALLAEQLLTQPLVSRYGALLREHFAAVGHPVLRPGWLDGRPGAAFAFTHDVDYPQMIRWIEILRLLVSRGHRGLGSIAGVLRGTNHFWRFADWIEAERKLGTRPAFYFLARQGSLLQYATGTPDGFYDVRRPEFRELFRVLRAEGCEIGLHASFHAHRSVEQLRSEKARLEEAAGVSVEGNRHHYWHLDPQAPNETLRMHAAAGFGYDASLGFEYYPGFRRGTCHPFRVFDPTERRELDLVELPTAWMDNHFDGRLTRNRIADPETCAAGLVETARATGGVVIVDYHVRGMNRDFYPRWGAWLMEFVRRRLDASVTFRTPREIVALYREHEAALDARSGDETLVSPATTVSVVSGLPEIHPVASEVGLLQPGEEPAWERFVDAQPVATIYHRLAWRAVTVEAFGHRPYYLRALGSTGEVTGVLPLFLVRGLYGRRLVSVPMRDRAGLVASSRSVMHALLRRAIALTGELDCPYLELKSLEPLDHDVASELRLRLRRHWITTRIDLTPGPEALWRALDKDFVRWAIGKARRSGVTVGVHDDPDGPELFHELFVRTRTAMGIPPFSRRLFQAIWHHLVSAGRANLFVARAGDEPINAMINFLSGDTFLPAYAAPQNAWRKSYPSETMIWATIEWAAQQGFRYYDFGADSPEQEGLLAFKRKWGGVPHPMSTYYHLRGTAQPPVLDSSRRQYALARRVWARLPPVVARPLGAWVTRQLS